MALAERERFTRCAFGQDLDMLPIPCDFSGSGLKHFLAQKGIGCVSDLELLRFFPNHVLYAYFGGICNQHVLPYCTPEEIDSNVQETTRILGKHGRFIISPSNGVGKDVPMENVEAYFQAAKKYRKI
ncbi:MAG: hypothetical protein HFI31_15465 [Lachnospiraceae bacterium]|nr:hypothetical protein [Lachnospiraceae bacterium]